MKQDSAPLKQVHPKTRDAWRRWLAENHGSSDGVWLVYFKKASGKPRIEYGEAVEEALCFGWVDSKGETIDDERAMLKFTPRNPKSAWSKPNKERVEKLIEEGRMTEVGLAAIATAKRNGTWSALDSVEALKVPADLAKALAANKKAKGYFDAFSPSSRKIILWWIESAKRQETREKRVAETVRLAGQNIKAK
ncbi:MAG TPA: YdeI/OmpD-associated family protein [Actinomycetota bacterium]|nr:YdeI/OmpD-associated family protein [Actinomycetota bacterium]